MISKTIRKGVYDFGAFTFGKRSFFTRERRCEALTFADFLAGIVTQYTQSKKYLSTTSISVSKGLHTL